MMHGIIQEEWSVVFFGIETYISSSSFRSKKFFFQVFLIITVKDTNLEDLFTDSISVFTTISFLTMNIKKAHERLHGVIQEDRSIGFRFLTKNFKVRSNVLQRTKMKTGFKTIPGAGHSPSTFVPTVGHLTAEVLPPPGICHP